MPRFAILEHDFPMLHWDFLVDKGSSLQTWRLLSQPEPGAEIVAEALPDHRRIYLDYEGPISGERGTVSQWDSGTLEMKNDSPEQVVWQVNGRKIQGVVTLTRLGERTVWRWHHSEPDGAAAP